MADRQAEFQELLKALRNISGPHFYLLRNATVAFKKDEAAETSVQRRTDHLHFRWSMEYWDKLTPKERMFMTMHTSEHLLSNHYTRLGPKLKNKKTRAMAEAAIDIATNHGIKRRFNFSDEDLPYLRKHGAWVDTVNPELGMSEDLSVEEYFFVMDQANQRGQGASGGDTPEETEDEDGDADGDSDGEGEGEGEGDEDGDNEGDQGGDNEESDSEEGEDDGDSPKKVTASKKDKKGKGEKGKGEEGDSEEAGGEEESEEDEDPESGEETDEESEEDTDADSDEDEDADGEEVEVGPLDDHATGEEGEQDISDLLEDALKALQEGSQDDDEDDPDDEGEDEDADEDLPKGGKGSHGKLSAHDEDEDEDADEDEIEASDPYEDDPLEDDNGVGGISDVEDGGMTAEEASKAMEEAFGLKPGSLAGRGVSGAVVPRPPQKDASPEREWRKYGYRLEKSVRVDKGRTSWLPNKRYGAMRELNRQGMFLPSYEAPKKSHIRAIIFLDVSGSCTWMLYVFMTILASIPKEIFDVTAFTFSDRSMPFDPKNPKYRGGGTSFRDFQEKVDGVVAEDKQAGKNYLYHMFVLTDGEVMSMFEPREPHLWHFMMYNPLTAEEKRDWYTTMRNNQASGRQAPIVKSETKWLHPKINIVKLDPFLPAPVLELLNAGGNTHQVEQLALRTAMADARQSGRAFVKPEAIHYRDYY